VTAPATAAPRRRWRMGEETRWALLFLSPWIIGFLVFTAGPMIASFVLSFTEYNVIRPPEPVGLQNYERLTTDRRIGSSLANTAFYAALHVPGVIIFSLALAMLLLRVGRAAGFFRTVFYLPAVTPAVAVGTLFLLILSGNGLLNQVLGVFGAQPRWLTDPDWVKPGIVIMSLWSLGSTVVIYFAALRNVPTELYEAAELDGAGAWSRFRHITVPFISGAIFFTVIVNTIASLQIFAEIYAMFFGATGSSSAQSSALFYSIYLFQKAFRDFEFGYASAMAWLLFVIILVITVIQVRVSKRFVYYAGDDR